MPAPIDRYDGSPRDAVAVQNRERLAGPASWDNNLTSQQLLRLIQAGADLGSDLVQYAVDAVDQLILQGGIDRMALVHALGEALIARLTTSACTPRLRRYLNGALLSPRAASIDRRRVLIVDFDFFTTVGGGQTFYRRLIERHPEIDFFYPSADPDLIRLARGELPPNAIRSLSTRCQTSTICCIAGLY